MVIVRSKKEKSMFVCFSCFVVILLLFCCWFCCWFLLSVCVVWVCFFLAVNIFFLFLQAGNSIVVRGISYHCVGHQSLQSRNEQDRNLGLDRICMFVRLSCLRRALLCFFLLYLGVSDCVWMCVRYTCTRFYLCLCD